MFSIEFFPEEMIEHIASFLGNKRDKLSMKNLLEILSMDLFPPFPRINNREVYGRLSKKNWTYLSALKIRRGIPLSHQNRSRESYIVKI
jgi:hypothetical protein